jgi:hypothetical protein
MNLLCKRIDPEDSFEQHPRLKIENLCLLTCWGAISFPERTKNIEISLFYVYRVVQNHLAMEAAC